MAEVTEAYLETRERLVGLVAALPVAELDTVVPASPAWTVKDVIGHVSGLAHDAARGFDNPAFDPTAALRDREQATMREAITARQVAERRDHSLEDILAEWDAAVASLLPMLRGDRPFPRPLP